jgi:hypothetical protein
MTPEDAARRVGCHDEPDAGCGGRVLSRRDEITLEIVVFCIFVVCCALIVLKNRPTSWWRLLKQERYEYGRRHYYPEYF